MALVYHDVGLWTDAKLAYLEPSCVAAAEAAKQAGLSPEQAQLVRDVIYFHHKVTPFVVAASADAAKEGGSDGGVPPAAHAAVVNAVRLADHIDASMGLITKGMPHAHIAAVMEQVPEAGFHWTLLSFLPRVRGWNIPRAVWELSSIIKW